MADIKGIVATLAEQNTAITLLQSSSDQTNEHLKTLNGKVLAHSDRFAEQTTTNALTVEALKALVKRCDDYDEDKKESGNFWVRNWEKLFFFLLACLWAYFRTIK